MAVRVFHKQQTLIFPQPKNHNLVLIRFSNFGTHHLILYNAVGELIEEWEVVGSTKNIEMDKLANGMYLLNYKGDGGTRTIKIIKR